MKLSVYKISSFKISFLNKKTGQVEETHRTMFRVKPICSQPENITVTLLDKLNEAVGVDKRDMILEVSTSKGKFIFNSKRSRKLFDRG